MFNFIKGGLNNSDEDIETNTPNTEDEWDDHPGLSNQSTSPAETITKQSPSEEERELRPSNSDFTVHHRRISVETGTSHVVPREAPDKRGIDFIDVPMGADKPVRRGSLLHEASEGAMIRNLVSFTEERENEEKKCCGSLSNESKMMLFVIVLPCFVSVWYSAAILFPGHVHEKFHLLLWTKGALIFQEDDNGNRQPAICPRPSICSEGIIQIILISIARITAFAIYTFMGLTFVSKMHCLQSFLSKTYLRSFIPFTVLHHVHTKNAMIFTSLAFIHSIAHYVRYILRGDVSQLKTQVHIAGLIGLLAILVTVLGMSSFVKKYKSIQFETRFNSHWIGMIMLTLSLCFHAGRTRLIAGIFFCLWALDFIYGMLFMTHNLEVVELLPLPEGSGVQMLWRNPPNFHPRSGEYVKIQLPWLKHGSNEWHPFSIYLKENTKGGWRSVHGLHSYNTLMGAEGGMSLGNFIKSVLLSDFGSETINHISSPIMEEAREDLRNRSETTQVFIHPAGDWSKGLVEELQRQRQLRACWVRGPYTSPYSAVQSFSHIILTASGIGITPALGVMGQYPGFSRTKILVWTTRDKNMLKFFAPLVSDAHLAVIFYTGKEKLDEEEVGKIRSHANIYLQQSRPHSLPEIIEYVIVEFENHLHLTSNDDLNMVDLSYKASWCVLYCGGSHRMKDELETFSKTNGVSFKYELFDW